jgi:TatA/E family protein of Tat protein translocase
MGIENPVHLLFIAAVALIVLGPKRLPELARSLGKGIREFRESIGDGSATGAPHVPAPPSAPVAPQEAVVVAPEPEAAQVDPPEPVRSGDHAPDRRSL